MFSVTVYESKIAPTFRVVAGDHQRHENVESYTVRIYEGRDRQTAIDAAYATETREDIKAQIQRFGTTVQVAAVHPKQKISEWLSCLSSHEIYDALPVAEDFQKNTGEIARWPTHSVRATRCAIENDPRGGEISGAPDDRVAYGYEIAEALARDYADHRTSKLGRGFIFSDSLEALKRCGK